MRSQPEIVSEMFFGHIPNLSRQVRVKALAEICVTVC